MSKTLEELGYEKSESETRFIFRKGYEDCTVLISFFKAIKDVVLKAIRKEDGLREDIILNMEELKAIYKYCEDSGWI